MEENLHTWNASPWVLITGMHQVEMEASVIPLAYCQWAPVASGDPNRISWLEYTLIVVVLSICEGIAKSSMSEYKDKSW